MKVKKVIKKGTFAIMTGALAISSTFTGVHAATKVETLLANMTQEEKAAQIMQVDVRWATPQDVAKYQFGSILAGGGAAPSSGNSMTDWAKRADEYQKAMVDAKKIPLLYGVDAVHGNNNVKDATMFPHNIGVSAANDEDLAKQIGAAVASEVKATGSNWTFTPTVGVPHNERWGRTYETFGDDYNRVTSIANAYIEGIQSQNVMATAKHFLGEGLTTNGTNQGNVVMDDADYNALVNAEMSNETVKELLTPYKTAINNGVQSIMVTYNSFNGVKTHGNYQLVTTLLRDKLDFNGVVVSDYNGLDQIEKYIDADGNVKTASTYKEKAAACVNAGVDLLMVAENGNWQKLYDALVASLKDDSISEARINEACTRILQAKEDLGLLDGDNLYSSASDKQLFGEDDHRAIARQAVSESMVLLKNTYVNEDQTAMQLLQDAKRVFVAGSNGNNIGNQCGGWTITWQGGSGNTTKGTTISNAIKDALKAKGGTASFSANGLFDGDADVAVVVAGEKPYAESNGDSSASGLKLSKTDLETIDTIKEDHPDLPIVLVLVTGRPLTIADQVKDDRISAIVSAWLPGSEGAGVADVLVGDTEFTGTNPITWPWYAKDIESKLTDTSKVLYATGYGLKKNQVSDPTEKPDDPDVVKFNTQVDGKTKIEAENYTDSYSASAQLKLENNNTTVGNFRNGSYVSYKISTDKDAVYQLQANLNANDAVANAFKIYVDDKLILDNTMTVPGQGDWTTFKPFDLGKVSIPEGEHTLKLLSTSKDWNIDWLEFTAIDDEYVPPKEPEKPVVDTGTGTIVKEGAVQVTMSSGKNSGNDWYNGNKKIDNKNTKKDDLDLKTVDDSKITTITVNDQIEYNSFLGMGTSIDESTVHNLWKMSEEKRYAFIKRLVDPVNGSGNTLFRLTIGTPDFVACPFYTYYDGTGTELNGQPDWDNKTGNGFSIQKDQDYHIIDTIKLIQQAAKECKVEDEIKFFASPWTPPGWMKEPTDSSKSYTNNDLLLKGGKLSDAHINDAAKYYVRYIEEYAKLGIPVYALTLQNEPMLEINYPSCAITAEQEAKLATAIKSELAKSTVLSDTQKDVKIWAFDHNPGDLNTYMNKVYNNAIDAVDGAAVHDYGGELSNMTTLHNNYNEKSIHLTERSVWGTTGMDRIAQYLRNYAESYNCWVTMLDSNIQTHQWVGTPDVTAFVQDADDPDNYWATPEVYLMGQFSKYIRPGFVRVSSNYGSADTITNVVFKNPDTNELIMVAINNTDSDQNFKVVNGDVQFNAVLPAKNCATYIWKAVELKALPISGTLTPNNASKVNGMVANTNFENVTAGANATWLVDVKEAGYYNVTVNHAIGPTNEATPTSNNGQKELVLSVEGQEVGTILTKRFDTWSSDWNAWGTYNKAHIQVYLEAGVQNLTITSKQDSINIGDLVFTKAKENTVPGYIQGTDYSYGENIIVEEKNGLTNIGFVENPDFFEYRLNIQKAGTYTMKIEYSSANDTAAFDLYLDDKTTPLNNVILPKTGNDWGTAEYKTESIENVVLPVGEHTLKFVPQQGKEFNFRSFSFGPYINITTADNLEEGSLSGKTVTVKLSDGQFVDEFDSTKWTLNGLPGNVPFEVTREDETTATIQFTGEVPQDFDVDKEVTLSIDASQVKDEEGYNLTNTFTVNAVDDPESIENITIGFGTESFVLNLIGGTFNEDIKVSDIQLSDSLARYIKVSGVKIENGKLVVSYSRVKTNYEDINGTITVKSDAYSDGNVDLESEVILEKSPDTPEAIIISNNDIGNLQPDKAYDNQGALANTQGNGDYEKYYLDVKDAGDYILEFKISNDEETSGSLSIMGGPGVNSGNNLASISFGRFWNNLDVSYKTLLHYDEPGQYTLWLRANVAMKLTDAKLYKKPNAIEINGDKSLTVKEIVDGSDDGLWAIEKDTQVGYTGEDAYQDYYVNVTNGGRYSFSIKYATEGTNSVAELISVVNGEETPLGKIRLDSTGGWATFKQSGSTNINLPEGEQILRLKVQSGGFNTQTIDLVKDNTIYPEITAEHDGIQIYEGTEGSVIELLGIKVMYGDDDITNDTSKVTIDTEYDANKAGQYTVKVIAKNSKGEDETKEFTIEVVSKPTLTYDKTDIVVGSEFDPLANLIIKDANGEVYTGEVTIVSNNVNVNKPGEYTIVYSIKDAFGNDVIFERTVKIVDVTDDNEPGTDKPGTDKPSTDKPSTDKPGTDNPSTDKPSTDNPSTDKPSTDNPSTDKPGTDNPSTDNPSTDNPSTDKPSTDKPSTDKPSTDKPSTDKPSTGNQQTDTGKKPHQTVQVSQTSQDDNQKTPDNTVTVVGTVQTSDDMNILPYAMIAGLAFIGILYGLKKRKMN